MLIIPAIDVYDKKTVRLTRGDFNQIKYYPLSPLEQACQYADFGFTRIHIVDLLGSAKGEVTILEILKSIKNKTRLEIEFGGGIRNAETIQSLLSVGIDRIIIGSLAVKDKLLFESILKAYNPMSFIISADVNNRKIAVHGWTETTSVSLNEHIDYCSSLGINQFLCTDISKDGTLQGTNTQLYSEIMKDYPSISLIASGGIKDIQDIKTLMKMNIYGTVVGKAIYENTIDLKELSTLA
ncbi:MAG: 1-(5-phosphoribosyl)-5-[(5-phosphoribosylamino)methylideneamino]imidazole-4-carboxamide isomerase [Ignavibacteriaceae bacterium]|nr:1-(5-phosphoribosyl)-5-[(5-phosphoribosylamino)methylideneamino]imidazole-4-carboxamide isomerase [Ignavibacteriaceae bacterium]